MATAGDRPGTGPQRAFAPDLERAEWITLSPEESLHLVRVRRVRVGDPVVLFDGRGLTRRGALETADARAARVHVEAEYPDRSPARRLSVAGGLPQGARADAMFSALAELGVGAFQPLRYTRSPRGREERAGRRETRWQRLLCEAAKVSGCSRLLEIHATAAFAEWIGPAGAGPGGVVLLDPNPAAPALVDVLPRAGALPWLVIGPEGGFTETERGLAASAGVICARLGATALRVETAAIAAAAVAATLA